MLPSLLERLFRAAERRRWTVSLALVTPAWVAVVRTLLERELAQGAGVPGRPPFPWFAHVFMFYLALHVCLTALLALAARRDWREAAGPVSMGLTLGTLPPLLDVLVSGPGHFTYEYTPGLAQVPWSLYAPARGLPWGECLVLWATVGLMGAAAVRYRSGWARGLALVGGTWALILLFLVGLPSASIELGRLSELAPSEWRNALFGTVTLAAAVLATGSTARLARRALHVALAPSLALLGAAARGRVDGAAALAAVHLALLSAGFAVANDWHDRAEDEAGGRAPAPTAEVAQLLTLVPLAAVAHVLAFRLELGLSLVGFAAVSHAYHADPLRLKCVFPLSYKTEGFLGGLAFFAGLAASPAGAVPLPLLQAVALVTLGTPLALVFKDWKDVEGDRAAGVRTAFVVLEGRGWSRDGVRRLAAGALAVALGVAAWGAVELAAPGPLVTAGLWALALLAPLLVALGRAPRRAVALTMALAEAQVLLAAWALWARPGR